MQNKNDSSSKVKTYANIYKKNSQTNRNALAIEENAYSECTVTSLFFMKYARDVPWCSRLLYQP